MTWTAWLLQNDHEITHTPTWLCTRKIEKLRKKNMLQSIFNYQDLITHFGDERMVKRQSFSITLCLGSIPVSMNFDLTFTFSVLQFLYLQMGIKIGNLTGLVWGLNGKYIMMIMFHGFSFSLLVQPLPGSFLPGPVPGAQQQLNRCLLNEEMNVHCADLDPVQEEWLKGTNEARVASEQFLLSTIIS